MGDVVAVEEGGAVLSEGNKAVRVRDGDDCAKTCNETPECKSFSLCDHTCYLKDRDVSPADATHVVPGCETFFREATCKSANETSKSESDGEREYRLLCGK